MDNLEFELEMARRTSAEISELFDLGQGVLVNLELYLKISQAEGAQQAVMNRTDRNVPGYRHTVHYKGTGYYTDTREKIIIFQRKPVGGLILP